jgi:hypothetical protein
MSAGMTQAETLLLAKRQLVSLAISCLKATRVQAGHTGSTSSSSSGNSSNGGQVNEDSGLAEMDELRNSIRVGALAVKLGGVLQTLEQQKATEDAAAVAAMLAEVRAALAAEAAQISAEYQALGSSASSSADTASTLQDAVAGSTASSTESSTAGSTAGRCIDASAADVAGWNAVDTCSASAPSRPASCKGLVLAAHGFVAAGAAVSGLATRLERINADENWSYDGVDDLATALSTCLEGMEHVLRTLPAAALPVKAKARRSIYMQLLQDLGQLTQGLDVAVAAAYCAAEAAAEIEAAEPGAVREDEQSNESFRHADEATGAAISTDSGSSSDDSSSNSDGSTGDGAISVSRPTAILAALLPDVGQRLVACGKALAALCPVPLCCNNPGCVELRGVSERQLVGGPGTRCSNCRWVS